MEKDGWEDNPPVGEWSVGSDRVRRDGERLAVFATEPMDWPIREFSRIPIFVNESKYYCRAKTKAERPYAMRYELWPWPSDGPETSYDSIRYDEAYVEARNRHARGNRRDDLIRFALLPLYPFLGHLWSGFKENTLAPIGIEVSSITKISVAVEFYLSVLETIFAGWLAGGMVTWVSGNEDLRWVDWALLLVGSADCAIRYSGLLRHGSDYHLGFCEWLWRRR
jgi:hypothetical protein